VAKDGSAAEYRVTVTKSAQRDLKKLVKALSSDQFRLIDSAILGFATDPRPIGYEPFKGQPGVFRYRVGDYRILYEINDPDKAVRVARVRDRKDVYRH